MKTANIFSLLNGKWFIHQQYGRSLLPSAFNIISGNGAFLLPDNQDAKEESVILKSGKKSSHQKSAASFDEGGNTQDYVLVIDLKNPIYKYNQECGPRGTKHKMGIMARYENDPNLKGVVLDIDSGGGQVSGTPEFYDFVRNYSKPVVAYTDGWMCSAAYYIGSGASHIVANKRADAIGSLGAMISFIDMSGIYKKKGATIINEYATKSTEKNKDFEELLKGNPEGYIKNELDTIVEDFHTDMKAVRTSLDEKTLSGGTWNASRALSLGLIDEIGTIQTAIDKVFELSKASTNKSNINNTNMNTEKLTQLMAVIGVENLNSDDNGVYLNEEQLQAIEQNITDQAAAVQTADATRIVVETSLTEAQNDAATITTEIQTALTTAEVDGAAEMNQVEGVQALYALVAEYGANDGAEGTRVAGASDAIEENVNKNIVGGIDISAAMNN